MTHPVAVAPTLAQLHPTPKREGGVRRWLKGLAG